MARHWPKVSVVVKQRDAIFDAPCADQQIDGFTHGDSDASQIPEIARSSDSDRVTGHRDYCETAQDGLDFSSTRLVWYALQHLAQHQITDADLLNTEDRAETPNVSQIPAA
jgi:hypothetical protein